MATVSELRDELRKRGLSTGGLKAALEARLAAAIAAQSLHEEKAALQQPTSRTMHNRPNGTQRRRARSRTPTRKREAARGIGSRYNEEMLAPKTPTAGSTQSAGVFGSLLVRQLSDSVRKVGNKITAPALRPHNVDDDEKEFQPGYHGEGERIQHRASLAKDEAKAQKWYTEKQRIAGHCFAVAAAVYGYWEYLNYEVYHEVWRTIDSWDPAMSGCSVPSVVSSGAPSGAHSRPPLGFAEVQALDACWHAEFGRLQQPLSRAFRAAFPGDQQRKLYLGFNVALLAAFCCFSWWLCCYLELIPRYLIRTSHLLKGVYRRLHNWCAAYVVGFAALCITLPALALYYRLRTACHLLIRRQHTFYADVQLAAVFSVREPPFSCDLLPLQSLDTLGLMTWLESPVLQAFVALPLFKIVKKAWEKASQQARERRDQEERYCDVVNFSLNMVQTSPDGVHTFLFRTFCELPTKQLVHNDALREELKAAAGCTEECYPLLHTLHKKKHQKQSPIASLNILCLNHVSQQVGAAFFAMDQPPESVPVEVGDYCFALTSERYTDDSGKMTHEDKLRCMLVKREVLETIVKDGNAETPLGQGLTYRGRELMMEDGKKQVERWQTMKAMARAWHDSQQQNNLLRSGKKPVVWGLQVPVCAQQGTDVPHYK